MFHIKLVEARHQWLTLIILATQEVEDHGSKPAGTNSSKDPISKKKPSQKRVGGVVQGVGPEFKSQY
jgi:hypothetical protein